MGCLINRVVQPRQMRDLINHGEAAWSHPRQLLFPGTRVFRMSRKCLHIRQMDDTARSQRWANRGPYDMPQTTQREVFPGGCASSGQRANSYAGHSGGI